MQSDCKNNCFIRNFVSHPSVCLYENGAQTSFIAFVLGEIYYRVNKCWTFPSLLTNLQSKRFQFDIVWSFWIPSMRKDFYYNELCCEQSGGLHNIVKGNKTFVIAISSYWPSEQASWLLSRSIQQRKFIMQNYFAIER